MTRATSMTPAVAVRASSVVLAAVSVLSVSGLAACSSGGTQVAAIAADTNVYPVVQAGQAGSILQAVDATRIRGVDPASDLAKDPRIVGPFRELSAAEAITNTELKKKAKTPAPITRERLLVPAETGWPRFFVAVGDTRDESTFVLQVLTTGSAREPYGLWAQPVMLPGATLPEVAPPATGAPVLAPDASGLVLAPKDVLASYASYLNQGATASDSKNFRRSTFSDQLANTLATDEKKLKGLATVTSKHEVAAGDPFTLRTTDGGALVIGALTQSYTLSVQKNKGKVAITDPDLAALAGGKKDFSKSFTRTAIEVLVFRVPPSGSEPITLIAAQRGNIKAELT